MLGWTEQLAGGLIRHNIHKEDVRFDADSLGNLVNPSDTYAVLSPLQSAHISPVDSSDIGQSLLREPAGRSQHPHVLCKIISARPRTRWSRLSSYAPRRNLFIRHVRKRVASGKSAHVGLHLRSRRILKTTNHPTPQPPN